MWRGGPAPSRHAVESPHLPLGALQLLGRLSAALSRARAVSAAAESARRQRIDAEMRQSLAMLNILYGASATALDAFRAADNPVDRELVKVLEVMVERTRGEIDRLVAQLANPS